MNLSDQRIQEFLDVMQPTLNDYDVVHALSDNLPEVVYPRSEVIHPTQEDNPFNAWYVKTHIQGAKDGILSGKEVVLKDNICLADVPMMNGASTLEGYVPEIDATVVTRLLDAGATIVGKAQCEYFCASGGSHTSALGPVANPHRKEFSAGGSSSGCGALVAGGVVDMAVGGDQGGSIRIPASFSGCYGMKPTHGLVPYTGVMPIDTTIDHIGPMTQNVLDNAKMLQAIAGEDGLDPRQYSPQVDDYVGAIGEDVSQLRIGVVKEGFNRRGSEEDVDQKVRESIEVFVQQGMRVEEISIPFHRQGEALWTPIGLEGLTNQMMIGNALGTGWSGLYVTSLLNYHANWRQNVEKLDDVVIISMLIGQFYRKHHHGYYYAKSQNLVRKLRADYDAALEQVDLLLMPTLPMKATPLPSPDASLKIHCRRGFEMGANTAPTDLTGHPAMSLPCSMSDGLPIGLMLVGKKWCEATIYRVAYAFEQTTDWRLQ